MNAKTKNIITLVLCGLLTLALTGAGISKLMGQEMHVQNFARWGYPPFFLYVVGASQIIFVILLWIKSLRKWAGLGILGMFIGAVATHIMAGETSQVVVPAIIGLFGGAVAFLSTSKA